ncbi:MAG TPA: SDR family NAD(P)-dependent oxidoreductase [Alphaproteobacteria bacterium]|nr:SDR family NAD(P)-dependent oxidoreductase [Alphaproteobacteria bacterium]
MTEESDERSFAKHYGPWALIAGGSEGVGASFARKFADEGINVVLVARKPEPLEAAKRALQADYKIEVRTLSLDLTALDAYDRIRAVTDDLAIGMLVYNAGTDNKSKDFLDRSIEAAERTIALNVLGQTRLAHHFGQKMRARGHGGIILVGSLLGYVGGGKMSIYAASKAYSHTLAKGLWLELKPYGVDVLGLVLSATRTPAFERYNLKTDHPDFPPTEPDVVVEEGLAHLGREPLWVVSDARDFAAHLRTISDAEAVQLVARSAADMLS